MAQKIFGTLDKKLLFLVELFLMLSFKGNEKNFLKRLMELLLAIYHPLNLLLRQDQKIPKPFLNSAK